MTIVTNSGSAKDVDRLRRRAAQPATNALQLASWTPGKIRMDELTLKFSRPIDLTEAQEIVRILRQYLNVE